MLRRRRRPWLVSLSLRSDPSLIPRVRHEGLPIVCGYPSVQEALVDIVIKKVTLQDERLLPYLWDLYSVSLAGILKYHAGRSHIKPFLLIILTIRGWKKSRWGVII